MSRSRRTALAEEVLALGTEDWTDPGMFYSLAAMRTSLTDPRDRQMLAYGLAVELLTRGLVVAGDADNDGFHPWDLGLGETIGRVITEWFAWLSEKRRHPMPGDLMWFDNTTAGLEIAAAVLAGEGWFPDQDSPGKWVRTDGRWRLPPATQQGTTGAERERLAESGWFPDPDRPGKWIGEQQPETATERDRRAPRHAKAITGVRTPIEEVLTRCTAGPVSAADLETVADTHTLLTDPLEQRMFAIGLAIEVLLQGLVEVGDFDVDGFGPWNIPVADAIGRIATVWGTEPTAARAPTATSDGIWFTNTEAGDELAAAVVDREG